MRLWFFAFVFLGLTACSRSLTPRPEEALIPVSAPIVADDLPLSTLAEAIDQQLPVLNSSPDKLMRFGPVTITRARYAAALSELRDIILRGTPSAEVFQYINSNFQFYEVYGGKEQGEVLLTSYYAPLLEGSLVPTERFSQPLYRSPPDLVSVILSSFSERFKDESALPGRVDSNRVTPYYTRAEIDGAKRLAGKGLELCWVDPIDAFFLHIQGSGTVRLPSGQELSLVYANKNGRAYVPIGKFLKPLLPGQKITLQAIEQFLRAASAQVRDQYLFMNPSYVFFALSEKRSITSLGVQATDGRTIAADPRLYPKGGLAYLEFHKPTFDNDTTSAPREHTPSSRFVLDQDSGGAITGPARVDLFWGRGAKAKQHAGVMQEQARVMYLVPVQK